MMDSTNDNGNNNNDGGDKEKNNNTPEFVTTSYVLDSLNSAIHNVMTMPENDYDNHGKDNNNNNKNNNNEKKSGYFELQKRLPDGSTRKATQDEMSSEDMKNKLEQSAAIVAKMTSKEKRQWAHEQRQYGNDLYKKKQYKQAIDIYLTCLVARSERSKKKPSTSTTIKEEKSNSTNMGYEQADIHEDDEWLLLPVMNNLAQCTLQLGWYNKTEQFCTMAMEQLGTDFYRGGPSVAKLYYKRGKSRRLRGLFDNAKFDLHKALWHLDIEKAEAAGDTFATTTSTSTKNNDDDDDDKNKTEGEETSSEQKAIERELQLLAKNMKEGKKNEQRQQRAMQKVLGGVGGDTVQAVSSETNQPSNDSSSSISNAKNNETSSTPPPLYQDKQQQIRTHSTIRKCPEGPPPYPRLPNPTLHLTYWQMYRLIIARAAQRLLDIIGDGEEDKHEDEEEDKKRRYKEDIHLKND